MTKYYVYKLGKNKTLMFTVDADQYKVDYHKAEFFVTEITTRLLRKDLETARRVASITLPTEYAISEQEL